MSEVEIVLGSGDSAKTVTLKPSLHFAKKMAALGGLLPVLRKLDDYDINTYSMIVAAGLNKTPADVEDAVFAAGLATLNAPLGSFVGLHFTGGKSETIATEETPPGES